MAYTVAWPTGLPQTPFAEDGATYEPMDNFIRSNTDAGPGKVRRKFTAKYEKLSFNMVLSPTQLAALNTFFHTTLSGVKKFQWLDHRTGAVANYRFLKEPVQAYMASNVDGSWWAVAVELEMVP